MSTYDPSALAVMSKNDGDILFAANLKELVNLEKAQFNGKIGNVNISSLPGEKIDYSKLNLTGQIVNADIVSVDVSKFTSLKVSAQSSPNNTVLVAAGTFIKTSGLGVFSYAGGSSPVFPLPGVGLNRIDVLVIDDAGTLSRVAGIEAASPVAPAYPINKIPLAEIFVRYNAGGVVIRNTDNAVDSYIKVDARPFFRTIEIPDATITGPKLVDYTIGFKKLNFREQDSTPVANALGVTYAPRAPRLKAAPNADAQPCGNGAVRGNKVYFCGLNRDYILEWDHVADVMSTIALTSGDHPGQLVKVGSDLYVICNDAFKIKKIDQANAVSLAVDLTLTGVASGAWTLVNALTPNGDGTTLYTLAKITGTPVSRLLRVKLDGTGVTHAFDATAGNALMNPQFIKAPDGTEYVVVHKLAGTTCTLERRLASDLTAAGSFALGATTALGGTFLGSDGQLCYIWDETNANVRVVDVTPATMVDVARFPLNNLNIAGAANEVTLRTFLSTSGGGNQYPYFDGRRLLLPMGSVSSVGARMTAIQVPAWAAAYQINLADNGSTRTINGFATDGEYIFAAISNAATAGAQIARLLG
jgi:hypothetical protein